MIIEHAKFNKHSQLPGEPVEQFVTSLYILAVNCNFGELKDKLIRVGIGVGYQGRFIVREITNGSRADAGKRQNSRPTKRAVHEQQVTIKGSD